MSAAPTQPQRTAGPVSRLLMFLLEEFVLMTVVWLIVAAIVTGPTGVLAAYAVGVLYLVLVSTRAVLRAYRKSN